MKVQGPGVFPPEWEHAFTYGAIVIFGHRFLQTWQEMEPAANAVIILAEEAKDLTMPDAISITTVLVFTYRRPDLTEADQIRWRSMMADRLPHPGPDGARPEKLSFTAVPDDPEELLIVNWSAGGLATQGVHAQQIKRYAIEIEAAYASVCQDFHPA